jgi:hypothetical protein
VAATRSGIFLSKNMLPESSNERSGASGRAGVGLEVRTEHSGSPNWRLNDGYHSLNIDQTKVKASAAARVDVGSSLTLDTV